MLIDMERVGEGALHCTPFVCRRSSQKQYQTGEILHKADQDHLRDIVARQKQQQYQLDTCCVSARERADRCYWSADVHSAVRVLRVGSEPVMVSAQTGSHSFTPRKVVESGSPVHYLGFSAPSRTRLRSPPKWHFDKTDYLHGGQSQKRSSNITRKSAHRNVDKSSESAVERQGVSRPDTQSLGPASWRIGQELVKKLLSLERSDLDRSSSQHVFTSDATETVKTHAIHVEQPTLTSIDQNNRFASIKTSDQAVVHRDPKRRRKALYRGSITTKNAANVASEKASDKSVVSKADLRALVRHQRETRRADLVRRQKEESERRERIQRCLAATATAASMAVSKRIPTSATKRTRGSGDDHQEAICAVKQTLQSHSRYELTNHFSEREYMLNQLLLVDETVQQHRETLERCVNDGDRLCANAVEKSTAGTKQLDEASPSMSPLSLRPIVIDEEDSHNLTLNQFMEPEKASQQDLLENMEPCSDVHSTKPSKNSLSSFGLAKPRMHSAGVHKGGLHNSSSSFVKHQATRFDFRTDGAIQNAFPFQATSQRNRMTEQLLLMDSKATNVRSSASSITDNSLDDCNRWMRLEAIGASEPELAAEDEARGRIIDDLRPGDDLNLPFPATWSKSDDALMKLSRTPIIPVEPTGINPQDSYANADLRRLIYNDPMRFSAVCQHRDLALVDTCGSRIRSKQRDGRDKQQHQQSSRTLSRTRHSKHGTDRTENLHERKVNTTGRVTTKNKSISSTTLSSSDATAHSDAQEFFSGAVKGATSSTPRTTEFLSGPANLTQPRLTATALSLRLAAEMNHLEVLSSSIQHVSDMESLRQFTTARAETAGLAQLLRTRNAEQRNQLPSHAIPETHAKEAVTAIVTPTQRPQQVQPSKPFDFSSTAIAQSPIRSPQYEAVLRAAEEFKRVDRRLSELGLEPPVCSAAHLAASPAAASSAASQVPFSTDQSVDATVLSSPAPIPRLSLSAGFGNVGAKSHCSDHDIANEDTTLIAEDIPEDIPSGASRVYSELVSDHTVVDVADDSLSRNTQFVVGSIESRNHPPPIESKSSTHKKPLQLSPTNQSHNRFMDLSSSALSRVSSDLSERATALKSRRSKAEKLLAISKNLALEEVEVSKLEREALQALHARRKQSRLDNIRSVGFESHHSRSSKNENYSSLSRAPGAHKTAAFPDAAVCDDVSDSSTVSCAMTDYTNDRSGASLHSVGSLSIASNMRTASDRSPTIGSFHQPMRLNTESRGPRSTTSHHSLHSSERAVNARRRDQGNSSARSSQDQQLSSGGSTPPLRKRLIIDSLDKSTLLTTSVHRRAPYTRSTKSTKISHKNSHSRRLASVNGRASANSCDDETATLVDDELTATPTVGSLGSQADLSDIECRMFSLHSNLKKQQSILMCINQQQKRSCRDRLARLESTLWQHKQLCTDIIEKIKADLDVCSNLVVVRSEQSLESHQTFKLTHQQSPLVVSSSQNKKVLSDPVEPIGSESQPQSLISIANDIISATDTEGDLQKLGFDDDGGDDVASPAVDVLVATPRSDSTTADVVELVLSDDDDDHPSESYNSFKSSSATLPHSKSLLCSVHEPQQPTDLCDTTVNEVKSGAVRMPSSSESSPSLLQPESLKLVLGSTTEEEEEGEEETSIQNDRFNRNEKALIPVNISPCAPSDSLSYIGGCEQLQRSALITVTSPELCSSDGAKVHVVDTRLDVEQPCASTDIDTLLATTVSKPPIVHTELAVSSTYPIANSNLNELSSITGGQTLVDQITNNLFTNLVSQEVDSAVISQKEQKIPSETEFVSTSPPAYDVIQTVPAIELPDDFDTEGEPIDDICFEPSVVQSPGLTEDCLHGLVADLPAQTDLLIEQAVRHLWQARIAAPLGSRSVALSDASLNPPTQFGYDEVDSKDLDRFRAASPSSPVNYISRRLLFDLVAESVRDIFAGEDDASELNGGEAKARQLTSAQLQLWGGPIMPASFDHLLDLIKPRVREFAALSTEGALNDVTKRYSRTTRTPFFSGFEDQTKRTQFSRLTRWTLSQKPYLDRLLELELRSNENSWLSYLPDEQAMKQTLADKLWNDVLDDALDSMLSAVSVSSRRANTVTAQGKAAIPAVTE